MTDTYLVLDGAFETVGVVEGHESLIWTERFLPAGDFEIKTALTQANVNLFTVDRYLWSPVSDVLMIIEDLEMETDEDERDVLLVSGRCLKSILDRRIVWGSASLNGNLQTEIHRILLENVVAAGNPLRRIPQLTLRMSSDPVITGMRIQANYVGATVFAVVMDVCTAYDIGWRIFFDEDISKFVFELYAGADRSDRQTQNAWVTLSPNLDNLEGSRYFRSRRPLKNFTLAGGEGKDVDRKYTEVNLDSSLSGLQRREMFTDASNLSSKQDDVQLTIEEYMAQLRQRGLSALKDNPEQVTFDGRIPKKSKMAINVDFFLGDILGIEDQNGMVGASRVTEYIRSQDLTTQEEYPTLTAV